MTLVRSWVALQLPPFAKGGTGGFTPVAKATTTGGDDLPPGDLYRYSIVREQGDDSVIRHIRSRTISTAENASLQYLMS